MDNWKECPFCGSNKLYLAHVDAGWHIGCLYCHIAGPTRCSEAAAIDAWNSRPALSMFQSTFPPDAARLLRRLAVREEHPDLCWEHCPDVGRCNPDAREWPCATDAIEARAWAARLEEAGIEEDE